MPPVPIDDMMRMSGVRRKSRLFVANSWRLLATAGDQLSVVQRDHYAFFSCDNNSLLAGRVSAVFVLYHIPSSYCSKTGHDRSPPRPFRFVTIVPHLSTSANVNG